MALTRLSNLRHDRVERVVKQVTFVPLLCVSVSAGTVKLFVCGFYSGQRIDYYSHIGNGPCNWCSDIVYNPVNGCAIPRSTHGMRHSAQAHQLCWLRYQIAAVSLMPWRDLRCDASLTFRIR